MQVVVTRSAIRASTSGRSIISRTLETKSCVLTTFRRVHQDVLASSRVTAPTRISRPRRNRRTVWSSTADLGPVAGGQATLPAARRTVGSSPRPDEVPPRRGAHGRPMTANPVLETAIADHGIIGDLQTAALVTTDGSIDWFCCPRFDSPSVFGALLDAERGGHCRIRPAGTEFSSTQMYLPDTAVLVTRFFTAAGMGQVVDFMPPAGTAATDDHRLVRMVQCVRGRMSFEIDVAPRFDYGRHLHEAQVSDNGVVFAA